MTDREKVIKGLEHCSGLLAAEFCEKCPYHNATDCSDMLIEDALKLLKEPDAVESIRRGKWIEKWFGYGYKIRCSECGYLFSQMTNYCPNCGAKMESEVE